MPTQVQSLVGEVLNSPKTYVDFEKLAQKLAEGYDFGKNSLAEFIEVDRLISDLNTKNGPEHIKSRLFETPVDVQAIEETKFEIERDSSLNSIEKAQLLRVVSHVSEQLQFVSNTRRQEITVGQFLTQNSSSSTAAYSDYSSRILSLKLKGILGESLRKGDIVDWEIDGIRTSPIDHNHENDDPNYLSSIANGFESISDKDKRVVVKEKEMGFEEVKTLRDHA